jgi:hypothetical protein
MYGRQKVAKRTSRGTERVGCRGRSTSEPQAPRHSGAAGPRRTPLQSRQGEGSQGSDPPENSIILGRIQPRTPLAEPTARTGRHNNPIVPGRRGRDAAHNQLCELDADGLLLRGTLSRQLPTPPARLSESCISQLQERLFAQSPDRRRARRGTCAEHAGLAGR